MSLTKAIVIMLTLWMFTTALVFKVFFIMDNKYEVNNEYLEKVFANHQHQISSLHSEILGLRKRLGIKPGEET